MRFTRRNLVVLLALVAGSAGLCWTGVKLSRSLLLRGLTAEVSSRDPRRALQAVEELERLDLQGIGALVNAAIEPREEIASAAQNSIEHLLEAWQREQYLRPTSTRYTQRLTRLALALATATATRPAPPAADWACRTADNLLHLAEKIPSGQRAPLVLHCETVLRQTWSEPVAIVTPSIEFTPAEILQPTLPTPSNPPALVTQPIAAPVLESEHAEIQLRPPSEVVAPVASRPAKAIDLPLAIKGNRHWQPQWSRPAVASVPVPQEPVALPESLPLREPTERELLLAWLVHYSMPQYDGPIQRAAILAALRHNLAALGFRDLPVELVWAALSPQVSDRLRLVDRLLTSRVRDAPQWLLLLARDENAQVRREAILALSTSGDLRMLAIARELALRDQDPQVAALATQIGQMLK